jgi:hypothetical protein
MGGISATRQRALDVLTSALNDTGLDWVEETPTRFTVELPGEHKRRTATTLDVGEHSIRVSAFVVRHPDENHAGMHHWMLERNARLSGIAFTVDPVGDVYLVGRLPISCVSADEIDALLGSVLEAADGSFNTLLELGFSTAITAEWAWRLSRGEPTTNLAAFEHLRPRPDDEAGGAGDPGSS